MTSLRRHALKLSVRESAYLLVAKADFPTSREVISKSHWCFNWCWAWLVCCITPDFVDTLLARLTPEKNEPCIKQGSEVQQGTDSWDATCMRRMVRCKRQSSWLSSVWWVSWLCRLHHCKLILSYSWGWVTLPLQARQYPKASSHHIIWECTFICFAGGPG